MLRSILGASRFAALAAVLIVCLAGASTAGAGFEHVSKPPTRLSLHYSAEVFEVSGSAHSRDKCEPDRRVRLFRRADGEDPVVDVARTNRRGDFLFAIELQPNGNRYYARIVENRIRGHHRLTVCQEDRSKGFTAASG